MCIRLFTMMVSEIVRITVGVPGLGALFVKKLLQKKSLRYQN
jgi:hypothetical protein